MRMLLVPFTCRAIGNKQGLTEMQYSRAIWSAIMHIQESPTMVELLEKRTPEVIPIRGPEPWYQFAPWHDIFAVSLLLIPAAQDYKGFGV